jgi:hypothetical protein
MDRAKESAALVMLTVAIFAAGCGGKIAISTVPLDHRKAGVACPQQRGPSCSSPCYPNDGGYPCLDDSNCTEGVNGRCGAFTFNAGGPTCNYDECFSDSDCDSGAPCECRTSASDFQANVCLTGSNCRIDSDCGPGGYCSPSVAPEGLLYAYYCHTRGDTCTNDSDCRMYQSCLFDMSSRHWACLLNVAPP